MSRYTFWGNDLWEREIFRIGTSNNFLINEMRKVPTENFKIKTFISTTGEQKSLGEFVYVNKMCVFQYCNSCIHSNDCPHCGIINCLSHTKCSVTGGGHFVMDNVCCACGLKEKKIGDLTKAAL